MRRRQILGLVLLGLGRHWGSSFTSFTCFQVVPMEGKGFGVVAEQPFEAGDLVYEEAPLIMWNVEDATKAQLLKLVVAIVSLVSVALLVALNSVALVPLPLAAAVATFWRPGFAPEELQDQWDELSTQQQEQIQGLSDCSGENSMMGILRTNGFSRGASASSSTLLLCPVLARLNHSCSPNCQQSWDEEAGKEKLYAMTKIEPGEELCITYCDLREPRDARQEVLRAKYGFLCSCPACCQADAESDARRVEAARLQEELPDAEAAEGLRMARRVLEIFDQEGIVDLTLRGLVCSEAARHCRRFSDFGEAQRFAREAYSCFSKARGPMSKIALSAKESIEERA